MMLTHIILVGSKVHNLQTPLMVFMQIMVKLVKVVLFMSILSLRLGGDVMLEVKNHDEDLIENVST